MSIRPRFRRCVIEAALIGILVATGCQVPGRIITSERSAVCPSCRTETKTTPLSGVYYEKHYCPTCGEYQDAGAELWYPVEETLRESQVLLCERWHTLVGNCGVCSRRRK